MSLKSFKEFQLSEEFALKLIEGTFKQISKNWFMTMFYWIMDSSYGQYRRVDSYLKSQLIIAENPIVLDFFAGFMEEYGISKDNDKNIVNVLKFIKSNIRYLSDSLNYGTVEKWADVTEIVTKKADDCDGINAMIYVLARYLGIPSYSVYSAIGNTNAGYHYYVLYLSTKTGKVYAIDGTFNTDTMELKNRDPFESGKEGYLTTDCLFNEVRAWQPRKK